MSVSDIGMLFRFIGGLGMFLYGMHVMADGLQKTAGNRMKQLLGVLTNNRLLAVIVGALVTAIIQSSSATTVMVVGFVNAGLIQLAQAVGVIMGANIGTTITSWVVSMSEWGEVLKPEFFAPLIFGIGAFFIVFIKDQKKKDAALIAVGLGILFIGLSFMSASITPYKNAPVFSQAFQFLGQNPFLGVLTGAVVTAIIQSSSASVGILQTLAMNGMVNWSSAVYITLGQNIGTCVTALLSSVGANKTAKRAAVIHLLFNVIGSILFGIGIFVLFQFRKDWAASNINSIEISVFHTVFNIANTIVLFPFANTLVKISGLIVKDVSHEEKNKAEEITIRHLDERILETPSFAVENAILEVGRMGEITYKTVRMACQAVMENNMELVQKVFRREKSIDTMTAVISEYLIKVSKLPINTKQADLINDLFNTVVDIERVGDHAENIAELAEYKAANHVEFSDVACKELEEFMEMACKGLQAAVDSRKQADRELANETKRYEEQVDAMEEQLRKQHLERLGEGLCKPMSGIVFLDLLSNLERISDHAENIAGYVLKE